MRAGPSHLRMKENLLVSVMVKLGNFLVFAIDRSYLFFSKFGFIL
jgi:hypothetical protein